MVSSKNVLIVGMARSGISAAKLCRQLGARVTIYDSKPKTHFEKEIEELGTNDYRWIFGDLNSILPSEFDLIIMSPGVPTDLEWIINARSLGISVISEIELAYAYCPSKILAITGTNGKTTTTTLVGEIVRNFTEDTFVVGNIGVPFTQEVLNCGDDTIVVAEISSFQLETIEAFKPKISAILNITPDHLNRHKTFENYVLAKLRITENQSCDDYCVLNADDNSCVEIQDRIFAKKVWFSRLKPVEGVYLVNDKIYSDLNGHEEEILELSKVKLLGNHNIENIMAAVAICQCAGVPKDIIRDTIYAFEGVEHRIEFVRQLNGVKYYNDSKATNPDAAIKGVEAMVAPTVLIAGGMDKGTPFDEWIQSFGNKVKALIVYGQTKYIIEKVARKAGYDVHIVEDLQEAVKLAHKLATPGDAVLLSPACASWDMFKDFEERGCLFKTFVGALS